MFAIGVSIGLVSTTHTFSYGYRVALRHEILSVTSHQSALLSDLGPFEGTDRQAGMHGKRICMVE